MSTGEQPEATFIRAYYPARSITSKENTSEGVTSIDAQGCCRRSNEWDECAGYPLLLREHGFFCIFLFGQLKCPSQDFREDSFQKH